MPIDFYFVFLRIAQKMIVQVFPIIIVIINFFITSHQEITFHFTTNNLYMTRGLYVIYFYISFNSIFNMYLSTVQKKVATLI